VPGKPDQYTIGGAGESLRGPNGRKIWADTDGKVTHFVAGIGRGATIHKTIFFFFSKLF